MLRPDLVDHPHRTLPQLQRVLARTSHDRNPPNEGSLRTCREVSLPINPIRYANGLDVLDANNNTAALYKFGARYYLPTTGRWTTQDPLTFLNNPAQGNRYGYAGDDPINNLDPTGQFSFSDIGDDLSLAGAVLGVGAAVFTGGASLALAGVGLGADIAGGVENGDSPGEIAVTAGLDAVAGGIGLGGEAAGLEGATRVATNLVYSGINGLNFCGQEFGT